MIRNIAILSALALSTSAFAEEPPKAPAAPAATTPAAPAAPAGTPVFETLDVNKDAALDKTEIAGVAQLVTDLPTVDADKNGKLARAEFDAWAAKQPKPATTAPAAAPATTPTVK